MSVRVELQIKAHCIETEAKNELKRITDSFFSDESQMSDICKRKIELLTQFLNNIDFKKLRASDERLSGIRESTVILSRGYDGKIDIDIYPPKPKE